MRHILQILAAVIVLVPIGCRGFAPLIFQPDAFPGPSESAWKPANLKIEDVSFTAADGTKLHGWFVPHPHPRVVVLYAPGNAGNVAYREPFLRKLHELGAATLIVDYRGYGKSEGTPTEDGILQDARAARECLAQRIHVPSEEIIVLGESLGGGVAVDLAAIDGAKGLILLSTFTSLPDVGSHLFPLLPVKTVMRSRLDSINKIGNFRGQLLQAHGDQDELIPYAIGRELFDACPSPDKTFVTLHGQGHNYDWPPELMGALDDFFSRLSANSQSTSTFQ